MEMFPNADPQYLKQQCKCVETEETFNGILTKMLEGENYPLHQVPVEEHNEQPGPSVAASSEDVIDRQHQILLAILPDADPTYLLKTCEEIGNDENAMKIFVANALEKKDYPTLKDNMKRQEALSLQKKYRENFSIEGFLEILPEPFKYFLEEKKNNGKLSEHGLAYLRGRYRKIRNEDINKTFKRHGYNLTLTCQKLDSFNGPFRTIRRPAKECRVPIEVNIPFLQEVAFIENKKNIENYLKKKSEGKKKAFKEAKARGELLTCGCCFDEEVMIEDIAACNEGHLFCRDCVKKGAEVLIGDGKTTFPCLEDCEAEFSLKTLQTVLRPSVLSKVLQRKQFEEVKAAGIEDLETCPFCEFANIPPREDKVFKCLNPECLRDSCRLCKEPNHIPLRCDEIERSQEVKMRTFIEDRMTEALVRTCWKCGKKFVKEGGCNKMTCTCGALMCYICRQPVKSYNHFCDSHAGPLGDKCPLFSTNKIIHIDPVIQEAKKAKQEMESRNPELKLKHDPTKLLPVEKKFKPYWKKM